MCVISQSADVSRRFFSWTVYLEEVISSFSRCSPNPIALLLSSIPFKTARDSHSCLTSFPPYTPSFRPKRAIALLSVSRSAVVSSTIEPPPLLPRTLRHPPVWSTPPRSSRFAIAFVRCHSGLSSTPTRNSPSFFLLYIPPIMS